MTERKIRIEWQNGVPNLEPLTGAEAKAVLRGALIEQQKGAAAIERIEAQRSALAKVLVALVHRECVRGLLDANGEPMLPMRTVLPADSVRVACEDWRFTTRPQVDESVAIEVDRNTPAPAEPEPKLRIVS